MVVQLHKMLSLKANFGVSLIEFQVFAEETLTFFFYLNKLQSVYSLHESTMALHSQVRHLPGTLTALEMEGWHLPYY